MNFYIGSYRTSDEGTLYEMNFNALLTNENSGAVQKIDAGPKPSFVCMHENKRVLYAVNELAEESDGWHGKVIALKKNADNGYEKISEYSTHGNYPCHVCLHQSLPLLFVVNYGSGSLCAYRLRSDGSIEEHLQTYEFSQHFVEVGPHAQRQDRSHAHQTVCTPCGSYLLVSDLGNDCIYTFAINCSHLMPLQFVHKTATARGSGPRHMVFSPCKNYLYVSAELSSFVLVFQYISRTCEIIFVHSLPLFPHEAKPYPRTYAAEIAHYNGCIYVSNRGDDSISILKSEHDGKLKLIRTLSCGGKTPRHFKIFSEPYWGGDGTLVLANQESDTLVFFAIVGDTLVKKRSIENVEKPTVVC